MKKSRAIFALVIIAILVCAGGLLLCGKWLGWGYSPVSVTTRGNTDVIRVVSPRADTLIASPVVVTGEARGQWYFEASFPVSVVDWDGKIIGQGIAQAQTDWATSSFVAFKAVVDFDTAQISGNYSRKGVVILQKDNPSGLPSNDDAVEIPITFK